MAVNRYTTVNWSAPTSSYIPKPFEEMMEVGKTMQKKYDTAIDDTYKLKDLMAKIPAIYDPQLGLSNAYQAEQKRDHPAGSSPICPR
jgi:hypothetical protein